MYPIPPNETLVETKTCRHCGVSFPITDKDLEFYDKVSPVFGGKKYSIPTPTLCPDCRQQRRLSFRNERKLYKRKCDATGRDIISIYSPDKPFKVYHQDFWWSDKWDPMDFGRDFDFWRRFFEQFHDFMKEVPIPHTFNDQSNINADYGNHTGEMKDCYLCAASYRCEDVLYGIQTVDSKSSLDTYWGNKVENSYQCVSVTNSHHCLYARNCSDSYNLFWCIDCNGCSDCLLCTSLQNKKYYIRNKEYSKEEFLIEKKQILEKYLHKGWQVFSNIFPGMIHKNLNIINCEYSIGDNISSCKNSYYIFDLSDTEGVKYGSLAAMNVKDVYDGSGFGYNLEKGYEIVDVGINSFTNGFLIYTRQCTDVFYCFNVHNSSHLFACIGLRNKSYCILNKQYTKEQYEELVPRIIEHMMKTGEWGEFFPASLSPFGYNETVAQEYYPLTKEQATMDGVFNWSDYEAPFPKVEKIIPASKLPEDITKVPDDILNWAVECEVTKKPFRIIKQELEFYRKHNLPIPRRHPDQRHLDRMALRNPRKLFERLCDCSNCEMNHTVKGIILDDTNSGYKEDPETSSGGRRVKMITTYAPERPERVYCEECYNREVF